MRPTLSRLAAKIVFLLFLLHFGRHLTTPHLFSLLVFDFCVRGSFRAPQMIKHKDSDCLLARNVIGSSEQRNKWQGPAKGGKDTVYAGYELEPMEWSATDVGNCFGRFFSIGFFLFCLRRRLFCRFNFLASTTSGCPNASFLLVLGLSFYPLE